MLLTSYMLLNFMDTTRGDREVSGINDAMEMKPPSCSLSCYIAFIPPDLLALLVLLGRGRPQELELPLADDSAAPLLVNLLLSVLQLHENFISPILFNRIKTKKSSKGQKCRTKSCNSGTPGQSREFRENPGKSGTVGKSAHLGGGSAIASRPHPKLLD